MGVLEYMRFPAEEYKRRCDKARELMEKTDLTGLFITEGGNYTYFSGGTRDFSFSRPHAMLLPRKGDPIAIVHFLQGEFGKKQIWFDDIRTYKTMSGLSLEMVVEAMKEIGMDEGHVGAEIGYEQRMGVSLSDFLKLKEVLPRVEFVDAADVFWGVRMIKSPGEVERHRRACQITVQAYNSLFPSLCEGMSEKEIVDRFLRFQIDMGGNAPWAFISSASYSVFAGGPTARRIQKGNQVWIDGGCSYREYASDFCCVGTVGPPLDKQREMQRMVAEINRTLVAAVRPGIKACDIDALNNAEWEKRGYNYSNIDYIGRIGHGLGWGSCLTEPPHIAGYDRTEIRPGMVFTLEPGIITEHGCYQTEVDLVVTEDGCEILNEMDRELRTIPI